MKATAISIKRLERPFLDLEISRSLEVILPSAGRGLSKELAFSAFFELMPDSQVALIRNLSPSVQISASFGAAEAQIISVLVAEPLGFVSFSRNVAFTFSSISLEVFSSFEVIPEDTVDVVVS